MTAAELIAAGYYQVSRRHCALACLPPGVTGKEALAAACGYHDGKEWAELLGERSARGQYLRVYAPTIVVDEATMNEFRKLGGEAA